MHNSNDIDSTDAIYGMFTVIICLCMVPVCY